LTRTVTIAGTSFTATSTSALSRAPSARRTRLRNGDGSAASIPAVTPANVAPAQRRHSTKRAPVLNAPAVFSARRTEADYQGWRDHQAWTNEKYRRFDHGERMPPDWRPQG
jgi:hypothetical protein